MDAKKIVALILGLGAIVLAFSKVASRTPPDKEYERLANSVSAVACSEDIQKQIPAPTPQPASTSFNDGIQALAGSDPNGAAQIENLVASVSAPPAEKPAEPAINTEALLKSFATGLQSQGWSEDYVKKMIAAKNPQDLQKWNDSIALKMKTRCPNASPKTADLLDQAFAALK